MKKRWISIYVENEIGVLARISGLFSGKSYNLDTLTVGETSDPSISRMTISVFSDDKTFEQIKKQLNRSVEVIKVIDLTDIPIKAKEIMYIKVSKLSNSRIDEIFKLSSVYQFNIVEYINDSVIIECVKAETENNKVINIFKNMFPNQIEIVRGGQVAIESICTK